MLEVGKVIRVGYGVTWEILRIYPNDCKVLVKSAGTSKKQTVRKSVVEEYAAVAEDRK